MVIYKYEFSVQGSFNIAMPAGAEVLCVQMQRETPCIWAVVDPEKERVERHFLCYGTGHEMNPLDFIGSLKIFNYKTGRDLKALYIGTFQMMQGSLVFHLFEDR
jgi:hypothetical protein